MRTRTRAAATAAALTLALTPAAADAHRPGATAAANLAKSWQKRHLDCDGWFPTYYCKRQQVIGNQPAGDHSRMVSLFIRWQPSFPGPYDPHYDCVRVDHNLAVIPQGDWSCWPV